MNRPAARDRAVELSRAVPETPDLMVQVLEDCCRVLTSPEHQDETTIASSTLAGERRMPHARTAAGAAHPGRGTGVNLDFWLVRRLISKGCSKEPLEGEYETP